MCKFTEEEVKLLVLLLQISCASDIQVFQVWGQLWLWIGSCRTWGIRLNTEISTFALGNQYWVGITLSSEVFVNTFLGDLFYYYGVCAYVLKVGS